MRILQYNNTGELTITNFISKDAISSYAIISHKWLTETEESTFKDLTNRTALEKPGYDKLRFCGEQVRQNDLQYFWVDKCCNLSTRKTTLNSRKPTTQCFTNTATRRDTMSIY